MHMMQQYPHGFPMAAPGAPGYGMPPYGGPGGNHSLMAGGIGHPHQQGMLPASQ